MHYGATLTIDSTTAALNFMSTYSCPMIVCMKSFGNSNVDASLLSVTSIALFIHTDSNATLDLLFLLWCFCLVAFDRQHMLNLLIFHMFSVL